MSGKSHAENMSRDKFEAAMLSRYQSMETLFKAFERYPKKDRLMPGKYGQDLISPEGWRIARGQVMIVPLMRQQIAAYEIELKRLRAEALLIQEQPVPEAWPEWVFEKLA